MHCCEWYFNVLVVYVETILDVINHSEWWFKVTIKIDVQFTMLVWL